MSDTWQSWALALGIMGAISWYYEHDKKGHTGRALAWWLFAVVLLAIGFHTAWTH